MFVSCRVFPVSARFVVKVLALSLVGHRELRELTSNGLLGSSVFVILLFIKKDRSSVFSRRK